ncbi:MAG: toll/interleukin-1 receptor domain-containing protein [Chloroflexota bacterium]
MYSVFISYSRMNEGFARQLASTLSDAGYDVWLDVEDIPTGMKWSSAIQQGLDEADVLIVIISPGSMASPNVEDEWQYALDRGTPVIPILYEPANIHFQLNRLQYIDFHTQDYTRAIEKLLAEISRVIRNPSSPFVTPEARKRYPGGYDPATYNAPTWMRVVQGLVYVGVIIFVVGALYINGTFDSILPVGMASQDINETSITTLAEVNVPELEGLTFYTSPTFTSASGEIDNPVFSLRLSTGSGVWYSIDNPNATNSLYVHHDDLPTDFDPDLLAMIPFNRALDDPVELYDAPSRDANSITRLGDVSKFAYIHGYNVDALGELWYYVYYFAARDFYWLPASAIEIDDITPYLAARVSLPESVSLYTDTTLETQTATASTLRILDQADNYFRVLARVQGDWQILYIDNTAITLAPLLLDTIPTAPEE